ncbi:oxygen-independent coproporphyrinogen III oxidase [Fodinibius sediminis]|uniref:Coproporphyrinogen-III oxidase n=1 Tax=Fodinibius sediminis TaxID=1214077 RepID=A0A521BLK5_9BACT|nr:oxygen-independent coproporphyrinogen III oxidase [Fodinibius sediminis]SMO47972.1 oxygen-independent coproporphyrinogen-3 oxidase [Fodinibius sediminis]
MDNIDLNLIKKYNIQGPRYTSYPTAVQFGEADDGEVEALHRYLRDRNQRPRPVSLYFHIPFCFSLCWYCGCTKIITKDQDRGDAYLDYLEKEMDLIADMLYPDSPVTQIHFGGGTPTFLKPRQLRRLGAAIASRFRLTPSTEFGVEIDPRRCTRDHITALSEIGCNRASLGVQDTNPEVQEAIHRIQPFEQTRQVAHWLDEAGINSVNFDLIYGLPRQTLHTFKQTMDDVLQLQPDRLAVYSYAHIPSVMPAQKLLKEEEMPSTDQKLGMLQQSISYLTERGYRFIGMDHFSREDEELSRAMDENTLQRNFQGYSTHSGADLYAFGMSGISNVGRYYWQNTKELGDYYRYLDAGDSPIFKTLALKREDLIRKDVIMNIMCRMGIDYNRMSKKWTIDFQDYFASERAQLLTFEEDGLIMESADRLQITEKGRLFLRNIAMCFDQYLNTSSTKQQFSKTV